MDKYKTMSDFSSSGVMPLFDAVVTAVPVFFPVTLFLIFIFGTGTSYFAILKFTNKKRFWHSLSAMSFLTFLLSLVTVAMNTTTIIYLEGYWVGFYILMILVSWFMLANYK